VIISGLPPSASWQDLKDFFRQAGDVIFTDVDRHGGGIVEFANKSDQVCKYVCVREKEIEGQRASVRGVAVGDICLGVVRIESKPMNRA